MSKRASWWANITPGGLIVTLTAALVTGAFAAATVLLYAQGDGDAGQATGALALSCLATTVALQARNRPDPAATASDPEPS